MATATKHRPRNNYRPSVATSSKTSDTSLGFAESHKAVPFSPDTRKRKPCEGALWVCHGLSRVFSRVLELCCLIQSSVGSDGFFEHGTAKRLHGRRWTMKSEGGWSFGACHQRNHDSKEWKDRMDHSEWITCLRSQSFRSQMPSGLATEATRRV